MIIQAIHTVLELHSRVPKLFFKEREEKKEK